MPAIPTPAAASARSNASPKPNAAPVTRAAARLREAGYAIDIVSAGSSPTARHAENFAGVTEIRAGVYMFGDLFQAEIETHGADAIAVTVLTSVIGRRPGQILVDAGGLALSKDRSTEATPHDYGFGLALDIDGTRSLGNAVVRKAYQEHGVIELDPAHPVDLPIGAKLRIAPNHTCMTAAAHDRYFVVDGEQDVSRDLAPGERLVNLRLSLSHAQCD